MRDGAPHSQGGPAGLRPCAGPSGDPASWSDIREDRQTVQLLQQRLWGKGSG